MVFASPAHSLERLASRVTGAFAGATVLGATTSGELTERGDTKGGAAAVAVAGALEVVAGIGTGLGDDPEAAVKAALEALPESRGGLPHQTGLLLLDPLAGTGEEAALLTAGRLGPDVPLAGGAAGDDLAMERAAVSLGDRVESDAIVIARMFSREPLGLGVCHGHEPISAPLEITATEGAKVLEVEGRPAWEVWREHTREAAVRAGLDPDALAPEDVTPFLLRYEAGLASGDEYKIRAPLSRGEDGSLAFACPIPTGAKIRITESVPERQIASARTAARRARERLGGEASGAIVFDCICRNLILGDRFAEAVAAVAGELGDVPLAGFETYGEIALDAGDLSGFHNTTTVVLAFPK
ncbi:MAG TPA: FIST C-terminal domain-containing protein [Sandaracinaceae bacterium LLY-WYZ-13_1]|nr:FIST C-terminal domain-containing protein [Sandaracinaceae bacterium LLY-WYZ-13_1]